jgi:hypothetical protein
LLIILIIGIIYYYFTKEAFLATGDCLDLDFNTDNKYTDYNKIFSKVYNNNTILNDSAKYLTFMNKDFTELPHQKAIASFLGLREAINLKATNDYQHYVIKHKMTVLFTSPVDKYLEITFNNFDNNPFVKIIYNHSNKTCIIDFQLPAITPLVTIGLTRDEIGLQKNGFGTKIEFVAITIRRNGVINNQFGIIIDNNMYCYKLVEGIENHFYNTLKNITIYASNTNINNTFTISHICSGEIYASYAKEKIESMRAERANYTTNATIKAFSSKPMFELIKPNTVTDYKGQYALGVYFNRPDLPENIRTNEYYIKPLILREGDYVKPAISYTNVWNIKNKKSDKKHYLFLNPDDAEINVNGSNYIFKGLGGDVFEVTRGSIDRNIDVFARRGQRVSSWYYNQSKLEKHELDFYNFNTYNPNIDQYFKFKPLALVREDCLEENPNNIIKLWDDAGSGADKDVSIWTYNSEYSGHSAAPGYNLAIFQPGNNQPPANKKFRIKESCLVPQPQLLTNAEISQIDVLVDDKINFYLTTIVNLKREKDAIGASDTSQMNNIKTFKDGINTMINNSKLAYDIINKQNIDVNDMQNQYNKHYKFINLLKDTITPIKTKETNLYNDYSPKIDKIISGIDGDKLFEHVNKFKEIDNQFINKSQETSDLVKQYNLQRESEKILQFLGDTVSK